MDTTLLLIFGFLVISVGLVRDTTYHNIVIKGQFLHRWEKEEGGKFLVDYSISNSS